jgi:hypothetical protein
MANFTLSLEVHPFITGFCTTGQRTILNTHIGAYDTLVSGTGASLTDILKIKDSEKILLPLSILQTTYALCSFKILLHTLLRNSHGLVVVYNHFVRLWDSHLMVLEAECADPLAPAKLVCWVQIQISLWFSCQYHSSVHNIFVLRNFVVNLLLFFPYPFY